MNYSGEYIAIVVAVSWTITALFAEVASKRLGSLQLNVIRMVLSLFMLSVALFFLSGSFLPIGTDSNTWLWLSLSGFVGYVLGDFCLFNSYVIIGSRFGQLFMTLAPPTAALFGWIMLGERLSLLAWTGMLITITGIGMSVLGKGEKHKFSLKLPFKGVLFGIGAGMGQGVGLVLSKVGMDYYALSLGEGNSYIHTTLPFSSTFIRAITGTIGFVLLMAIRRQFHTLPVAMRDKKGMKAALWATVTGPFIGVSLSLMATQYTAVGIASTLMALTPVMIIWPAHMIFKQQITIKEVAGAIISVIGVALFFIR